MPSASYASEIIRDWDRFSQLRAEWDDLFRRAENPHLSQSFEWISSAWSTAASVRGGRMHVQVLRDGGRIVSIWPLVVYGHRRHWQALHPLAVSADYTEPLVEKSQDALQIADHAVRLIRKGRGYDLFVSEWVEKDSLLAQVLRDVAPVISEGHQGISWSDVPEWDGYERSISGIREIRRRLRRLQETGTVEFGILDNPQEQLPLVPWLMERKLQRFVDIGDAPLWDPIQQQNFISTAMENVREFGRFLVFTLKLDGELLAVLIAIREAKKLIIYQHTQQPGFEKFGPGILIWRVCIKYAFDNKLDVEFGSGRSNYKGTFSNADVPCAKWILPVSLWGRARVAMTRLGDWRRERLAARRAAAA